MVNLLTGGYNWYLSRSRLQPLLESLGCGLLQSRQDMAVGVERNSDGAVAEPFAHYLGMDTLPQVMETNPV